MLGSCAVDRREAAGAALQYNRTRPLARAYDLYSNYQAALESGDIGEQ
jgi:hypothetical protein